MRALRGRSWRAAPGAALVLQLCLGAAPARAGLVVEPTVGLGVDVAYDSNVFNGRGPDVVTRLQPRAALRLRDERTTLTLAYDLGAWFYARGKADSSLNHRAVAVLESRLTRRLTLRLADELVLAGDPGFLLRAGVVAPQTSIHDNFADLALGWRATRILDGDVGLGYRRTSFGEVPAGAPPLHDGDQVDAQAGLSLRAGRADDVRLAYRFQYFTADGDGLAVTSAPAIAWRHRFLPSLEGRVEAGPLFYTVLDEGTRDAPAVAGRSGTTWRGSALLRWYAPPLRASLAVLRDLVGGTGAGSVLWAEYVVAQVGWRASRRVDLRVGGGLFANGYAPSRRRSYDGAYGDALLDVELGRGVHLAAYYALRWQQANDGLDGAAAAALPDITRHLAGLRLSGVLGAEARPPRRPRGE